MLGRGLCLVVMLAFASACGSDDAAPPADAAPPTLSASASPGRVIVGQGESAEITITVAREGTTAPVLVALSSLPLGVTASPLVLVDGVDTGRITIAASLTAPRVTTDVQVVASAGELADASPLSVTVSSVDGLADRSLAGTGIVTTSLGSTNAMLSAVAVQPDGGIVVAGTVGPDGARDVVVARFHPDGTADTSFAGTGSLTWDLGQDDVPNGVAVLPSGRIVVVASSISVSNVHSRARLYEATGSIATTDPSFGATGTLASGALEFGSGAIAIPAGAAFGLGGKLYRFAPGEASPLVSTFNAIDNAVFAAPDANTLFAAQRTAIGQLGVTRFRWEGSGYASETTTQLGTSHGIWPTDVIARPNGRAIVSSLADTGDTDFLLSAADTITGTIATTFGLQGRVVIDFAHGADRAEALVGTSTGMIVGGFATMTAGTDLALVKLYESGDIDHDFGIDGRVTADIAGGDDGIMAMANDPSGRLVAVGYATENGQRKALIARYRIAP